VIKWLLKKWFGNTPVCPCGWSMKPFDNDHVMIYQWKCIWKYCKWECFEDDMGKLHWWQKHR